MARIQYKGNFYDTNDPQQNAELLRLQRAENLKKAMQSLQPNRQDAPQKKLEAANLLAQNQALLNARTGVPPVSPNTYNVLSQNNGLLEVAPPNTNIDERAARVRSLLDSQQVNNNNTASNQVNPSPAQSAQPQPKRTLGQRASGLFDRVSDAYMGAAPIFAVAQEFQKAGALRPIGSPMQGDPYGKMMQIQQGRQQAENLAQLREQYPQFANLSDKNFEQVITNLASDGKLNRPQLQPDLTPESYQQQFPEVYAGDMVADQAYGAKDRFDAGVSAVTGALGLPLKTTEKALAATVTYNKEVMEAQKTKYTTRDSVYQMKSVEEMLPKPKMNEYKALQQTYQIRDIFSKAKSDLQAELARGGLTASQEGKIREGIRKFDNIIIRSNNRIDSMEGARGVSMNVTSSTPNWEGSMQEAESTFGVLENVRSS